MNFRLSEFMCKHCGLGKGIVKNELLERLQLLRWLYGKAMIVNCGYRCPVHNVRVGGAPKSAHLTGEAADIHDPFGSLKDFCTPEVLEKVDLWAEDYSRTKSWIHLQIRPASQRIFKP